RQFRGEFAFVGDRGLILGGCYGQQRLRQSVDANGLDRQLFRHAPFPFFQEGEVRLRHAEPLRRLLLIPTFQFSSFPQLLSSHVRLHDSILLQNLKYFESAEVSEPPVRSPAFRRKRLASRNGSASDPSA